MFFFQRGLCTLVLAVARRRVGIGPRTLHGGGGGGDDGGKRVVSTRESRGRGGEALRSGKPLGGAERSGSERR